MLDSEHDELELQELDGERRTAEALETIAQLLTDIRTELRLRR